jgi:hypothetical protein
MRLATTIFDERPPVSPILRRVIQRASRTRRNQARLVVARCLEQLPHYRELPPAMLKSVYENVLYQVSLFYRLTLEGHSPAPEDLLPSCETARLRARQGVPLGELFTFYQVGLTMVWEHLIASVGANPVERAHLLDRMAVVISNHTQVTNAATAAYVEERERLSSFREHDLDDLARLLLAAEPLGARGAARRRARGAGAPGRHRSSLRRPRAPFPHLPPETDAPALRPRPGGRRRAAAGPPGVAHPRRLGRPRPVRAPGLLTPPRRGVPGPRGGLVPAHFGLVAAPRHVVPGAQHSRTPVRGKIDSNRRRPPLCSRPRFVGPPPDL